MSNGWPPEPDEPEDLIEIPVIEPQGFIPVKMNIPTPTIEQVTGQVARQILERTGYDRRGNFEQLVADSIESLVDAKLARIADEAIAAILEKPLQPTDGYGNPVGAKTTLQAIITRRVESWANENVDHEGRTVTRDSFHSQKASRLEWLLGRIIGGDLQTAVRAETDKIVATLKAGATNAIAKQIAEKISGLVIK